MFDSSKSHSLAVSRNFIIHSSKYFRAQFQNVQGRSLQVFFYTTEVSSFKTSPRESIDRVHSGARIENETNLHVCIQETEKFFKIQLRLA